MLAPAEAEAEIELYLTVCVKGTQHWKWGGKSPDKLFATINPFSSTFPRALKRIRFKESKSAALEANRLTQRLKWRVFENGAR